MPQLTSDEWPADGEETTTEQEVPISDRERAAVAERRARAEHAPHSPVRRDDLLEHVVLHGRCSGAVTQYDVPLRDVIDAQHLVHDVEQMWSEGCPNDCRDVVCQPLHYALLLTESAAGECERHPMDVVATLMAAGVDFDIRPAAMPPWSPADARAR
jgi:hypothetical protein